MGRPPGLDSSGGPQPRAPPVTSAAGPRLLTRDQQTEWGGGVGGAGLPVRRPLHGGRRAAAPCPLSRRWPPCAACPRPPRPRPPRPLRRGRAALPRRTTGSETSASARPRAPRGGAALPPTPGSARRAARSAPRPRPGSPPRPARRPRPGAIPLATAPLDRGGLRDARHVEPRFRGGRRGRRPAGRGRAGLDLPEVRLSRAAAAARASTRSRDRSAGWTRRSRGRGRRSETTYAAAPGCARPAQRRPVGSDERRQRRRAGRTAAAAAAGPMAVTGETARSARSGGDGDGPSRSASHRRPTSSASGTRGPRAYRPPAARRARAVLQGRDDRRLGGRGRDGSARHRRRARVALPVPRGSEQQEARDAATSTAAAARYVHAGTVAAGRAAVPSPRAAPAGPATSACSSGSSASRSSKRTRSSPCEPAVHVGGHVLEGGRLGLRRQEALAEGPGQRALQGPVVVMGRSLGMTVVAPVFRGVTKVGRDTTGPRIFFAACLRMRRASRSRAHLRKLMTCRRLTASSRAIHSSSTGSRGHSSPAAPGAGRPPPRSRLATPRR